MRGSVYTRLGVPKRSNCAPPRDRGVNGSRLFLAELIQALLHLVELALELIHFAARTLRLV